MSKNLDREIDLAAAAQLEAAGYTGLATALRRRHEPTPAPAATTNTDPVIEAIRVSLGG